MKNFIHISHFTLKKSGILVDYCEWHAIMNLGGIATEKVAGSFAFMPDLM